MKKLGLLILFCLLTVGVCFLFPWLFEQVAVWQREFNGLLTERLHQIEHNPIYAGMGLIVISFLYGVFHALGPGHGKFIITGYLSTRHSKLTTSMQLTFLSSLMQGIVAVSAVSVIVVVLNLSSVYFKVSQLWLERMAFIFILLLGVQWCYQSLSTLYRQRKVYVPNKILAVRTISQRVKVGQHVLQNAIPLHIHHEDCGCGHQHLPNPKELDKAQDIKSRFLVILSIGMRPCTGAVFILFLSYMLDLYYWGIAATMAMSIGTGMTLSGFALLVLYARQTAVKLGKWYISPNMASRWNTLCKLLFGLLLIGFSISLIYTTTLPSSGGAVLLGR